MAKPAPITIPTEPIGSIPRPRDLIARVAKGDSEDSTLAPLYEDAIRDTIERVEVTGSPVVRTANRGSITISVRTVGMGFRTPPGRFKIPSSDVYTRLTGGAMSVKSLLITTAGESHDVPLAGCLGAGCR